MCPLTLLFKQISTQSTIFPPEFLTETKDRGMLETKDRSSWGKLVIELMEGEKGNEMKRKAMEWKAMAEEAACPGGSSCKNFENLLADILLVQNNKK
jgi:coenzyme F420-reducing hydrogenase beta subunit